MKKLKKSNAILFMEVNMNTNQENNGANEKGTDLTVKINKEFILRNISLILSIALVLSLFTTFCVVNSSEYGYGNDLAYRVQCSFGFGIY
ncbi:hypothetical protein AKG39_09545 [Acetobacterium bakii]|uniref:Uncharacterized protein n=2 Tax=Acetobacterium bakii TaxID=52689 RepID=A0A0L6U045_9FIRM|nr:hypothetical protein [Acetobacterium bakii]KNZ41853.1 hypothetical protein AKG39_09545 [Acetobacterium bakii]